jgi:hypothetical protein
VLLFIIIVVVVIVIASVIVKEKENTILVVRFVCLAIDSIEHSNLSDIFVRARLDISPARFLGLLWAFSRASLEIDFTMAVGSYARKGFGVE